MPSLMGELRKNVDKGGKIKFQHWLLVTLMRFQETKSVPPDVIPGPRTDKGDATTNIHLRCQRCKKPNTSLLDINIDSFSRLTQSAKGREACRSCLDKAHAHRWESSSVVYRPRFSGPSALGKLQKTIRTFSRDHGVVDGMSRRATVDKKRDEDK